MIFDVFPFNGEDSNIIKDRICNADFKIPRSVPVTEELIDFLRGVLCKDPLQRFDIYRMKTHKWLLLSDSAIQLKVDLAQQAYKREQQKKEKEQQKEQEKNNEGDDGGDEEEK